jgi:hypothetical protein
MLVLELLLSLRYGDAAAGDELLGLIVVSDSSRPQRRADLPP